MAKSLTYGINYTAMKFIIFLVHSIFWLWVFIVPVLILGGAGAIIYLQSADNLIYSIILAVAGMVIGFLLAERIRKKVGLTAFFGRLISMPEMTKKDEPSQ